MPRFVYNENNNILLHVPVVKQGLVPFSFGSFPRQPFMVHLLNQRGYTCWYKALQLLRNAHGCLFDRYSSNLKPEEIEEMRCYQRVTELAEYVISLEESHTERANEFYARIYSVIQRPLLNSEGYKLVTGSKAKIRRIYEQVRASKLLADCIYTFLYTFEAIKKYFPKLFYDEPDYEQVLNKAINKIGWDQGINEDLEAYLQDNLIKPVARIEVKLMCTCPGIYYIQKKDIRFPDLLKKAFIEKGPLYVSGEFFFDPEISAEKSKVYLSRNIISYTLVKQPDWLCGNHVILAIGMIDGNVFYKDPNDVKGFYAMPFIDFIEKVDGNYKIFYYTTLGQRKVFLATQHRLDRRWVDFYDHPVGRKH